MKIKLNIERTDRGFWVITDGSCQNVVETWKHTRMPERIGRFVADLKSKIGEESSHTANKVLERIIAFG